MHMMDTPRAPSETEAGGRPGIEETEARLDLVCDATGIATWDADLVTGLSTWTPNLYDLLGLSRDEKASPELFFRHVHPDDVERVRSEFAEAMEDGRDFASEFRIIRADGEERHMAGRGRPMRDAQGRPVRFIGINEDITDRKLQERKLRLANEEMNHRIRNVLAVVGSIARSTFNDETASKEALDAFVRRLDGFAAAHGLLMRDDWKGAPLRDLILASFDACGVDRARVSTDGPERALPSQDVLGFALAFHELCTNAIKYGALSVPEGRVTVRWREVEAAGPALELEWREEGGPAVEPPARRGFGRQMIERALGGREGAAAEMEFRPSGLVCRIRAPVAMKAPPPRA